MALRFGLEVGLGFQVFCGMLGLLAAPSFEASSGQPL